MSRPLIACAIVTAALAAWPGSSSAASTHFSNATLHATRTVGNTSVSSNWAGYAVTGTEADGTTMQFTSAVARWIEPRARCSRGDVTFSSFWVGLGGDLETSQALEQIGTSADCSASGRARYSMWYELVPAPPRPLKLKILPGNLISASVSVAGTTVTLQIRNLTRRTTSTHRVEVAAPDLSSAEWITEAPSACNSFGRCHTLPLTNFGHVAFTRVSTTTALGHTGTLTDAAWQTEALELIEEGSALVTATSGAVPGDPSPDGTSFGVDWAASLTPPGVKP